MDDHYKLRLVTHPNDREIEEVDAFLDLDTQHGRDQLRRHFIYMACTAEGEDPATPTERMHWLSRYALCVHEPGHSNHFMRYREV